MAAATNTPGIELDPKYDDYDYPVVAPVKQDGHPGHLTPEQIEKVKQLRASLESKGYTDRLDTLTLVCDGPRGHGPWGRDYGLTRMLTAAIPACAQVRPGCYRGDVRHPPGDLHAGKVDDGQNGLLTFSVQVRQR